MMAVAIDAVTPMLTRYSLWQECAGRSDDMVIGTLLPASPSAMMIGESGAWQFTMIRTEDALNWSLDR